MASPFQFVNRRGSAALTTTSVTVGTSNVTFTFQNHAFLNSWYRGTILINLAQNIPTGTATTLPIMFETNGVTQAVTKVGGVPLTVADIIGTGVYEFWFDKPTNTLQLIP